MVKFLKRWNGNFFSRRLALLLIVVLYFLGQALIVFDGHMDGRNHLVWLDGFPIFLGQVTIRFDACKWLSNVHHRSNNFIAPVYGKFPSFLVSILFSGILGRWWELCILGKLIWIDSVERRSHSPTYYSHESALPATNHLIVIFFLFLLFFCILLHRNFLLSNWFITSR